MKPHDPRYAAVRLDEAPDLDASVAYVIMAWPVIDPLSRYRYAKGLGREGMVENHHRYWGDEAAMTDGNPQLMLERGESVEMPPALLLQGADDDVLTPGHGREVRPDVRQGRRPDRACAVPRRRATATCATPARTRDRSLEAIKSFIARQLRSIDEG